MNKAITPLFTLWLAVTVYIGHFRVDDREWFIGNQFCETLLLACILLLTKGIMRILVATCTLLSFMKLIDEVRNGNTIPTVTDLIIDFIAIFITLYLIHRWLKSKKK